MIVIVSFQTWQDLKKNVKNKAIQIKKHANATGGGGPPEKMDDTDETVLDLINPISFEGIPNVEESEINFKLGNNMENNNQVSN